MSGEMTSEDPPPETSLVVKQQQIKRIYEILSEACKVPEKTIDDLYMWLFGVKDGLESIRRHLIPAIDSTIRRQRARAGTDLLRDACFSELRSLKPFFDALFNEMPDIRMSAWLDINPITHERTQCKSLKLWSSTFDIEINFDNLPVAVMTSVMTATNHAGRFECDIDGLHISVSRFLGYNSLKAVYDPSLIFGDVLMIVAMAANEHPARLFAQAVPQWRAWLKESPITHPPRVHRNLEGLIEAMHVGETIEETAKSVERFQVRALEANLGDWYANARPGSPLFPAREGRE